MNPNKKQPQKSFTTMIFNDDGKKIDFSINKVFFGVLCLILLLAGITIVWVCCFLWQHKS